MNLPKVEIIVIDGASTDGTREYLRDQSDIRFIPYSRRVAWSEANQIGLDRSTGEWICLSNPDIVFNDDFRRMFETHKDDTLAMAPQLVFPDGRLQRPARVFTPWLSLCAHTRMFQFILRLLRRQPKTFLFPYQPEGNGSRVDCPQGSLFMFHRSVLEMFNGHLWNKGYQNGVSDIEAFLNMKQKGITMWLFPQYRVIHYGSYITRKHPGWIERDQTRGLVLYFRYHPEMSRRISPVTYSILFGLAAFTAVVIDVVGKLVKRKPFFNPRSSAWIAGQRFMGLVDGWRCQI